MTEIARPSVTMDELASLCKRRGFVFSGSEIYGGLANTWDFGPLGVELRNNIKQAWWQRFVRERPDMVGLDGGILMNPRVWEASGHVAEFNDPLVDCKECRSRYPGRQPDRGRDRPSRRGADACGDVEADSRSRRLPARTAASATGRRCAPST